MPTPGKITALGRFIVRYPLWFAAVIVLIDQASKLFVKGFDLFGIHHAGMQLYESKEIFGDFLRFTYVENPGMAFGLNFGMPIILSAFSIGASLFLVYLIRRSRESTNLGLRIAFAMILGGAVGNLIDRVFYGLFYNYAPLFYGKVVDFVDVNIPDVKLLGNELHRFYVFNIADAAVSVGVVLLLFFYPSKKHTAETPARENTGATAAGTPDDAQSLPHQQLNVG